MKCEICNKDNIENMTNHLRLKHGKNYEAQKESSLVVDEITEKPLSELILDIKGLLRHYRNDITVKTVERGGKMSEIEITARIQL